MAVSQFSSSTAHLLLAFFFFSLEINGTDEGQSLFRSPFPHPATLAAIFRNISRATQQLHGARLSYTQVLGTILSDGKNGGSSFSIPHIHG